jgi:hypothetical protein
MFFSVKPQLSPTVGLPTDQGACLTLYIPPGSKDVVGSVVSGTSGATMASTMQTS